MPVGSSVLVGSERNVQGGDVGHAVIAAERRVADVIFRAGGGIDDVEEDERQRQCDHADIDVADPPIEHEIAERRRERRRQQHRESEIGAGAVADIDRGDRIGVGAEPEKGGMAEAQNAAIAPDETEAQRQDRQDDVERDLQQRRRDRVSAAGRTAAPRRATPTATQTPFARRCRS